MHATRTAAASAAALIATLPCRATNIVLSIIEQPLNKTGSHRAHFQVRFIRD